jgi:hypothetical protein
MESRMKNLKSNSAQSNATNDNAKVRFTKQISTTITLGDSDMLVGEARQLVGDSTVELWTASLRHSLLTGDFELQIRIPDRPPVMWRGDGPAQTGLLLDVVFDVPALLVGAAAAAEEGLWARGMGGCSFPRVLKTQDSCLRITYEAESVDRASNLEMKAAE